MAKPLSLRQAGQIIKKLREEVEYHEKKYYVDNDPQISDYEFDLLYKKLQKLEHQFPELISPESPTQRVGEQPVEGFKSVEHSVPMLSLDNCYSADELREFEERVRKIIPGKNIEYMAELKIDGLGISVTYREKKFHQAVTRGDGLKGDDVTANVRTIKSFPLMINIPGKVEVKGEIYLPFRSFQKVNKEREEKNMPAFANPRNAAAGSIRLLDPKEVSSRKLDVFLYSIYINEKEQRSQSENLKALMELDFKTNPFSLLCSSLEEVLSFFEEWRERRDSLEYDVDGIVVKVNSTEQQRLLGSTAKFPRWAISFKFPARQTTTKINNIIIQVGRTGALTPVAVLDPVKLSGITISRSTLHNEEEVRKKDIRIGDYVLIERSGDVIPKVLFVMKERRSGREVKFIFPAKCPACSSSVFKPEGEVISRCTNPSCPAKLRESALHFVSRRAMNIEGLGSALIDQLLKKKRVKKIQDLYALKFEELVDIERMGDKSSQNLLDEIEKSKEMDVDRLIYALGIRFVGERTAQTLAYHFKGLEALAETDKETLTEIHDIGPKVAESVVFFFNQSENIELVKKLKEAGLNFRLKRIEPPKKNQLRGQTFVITGTLSSMAREEAKNKIEELGGNVTPSVSKKTSYVIVGDFPGSKLQNARKLGIRILDEEEFLKLIGNE
ncbi:NAD-dependent DNA ligase LigA [Acidobacteriota bacterium]